MLLPFRRRPILPKPSVKLADTHAQAPEAPSVDAPTFKLQHLDYNHRPLNVEGLSHYIQAEADERFRVH